MEEKKENRGGYREGAGRKPKPAKEFSDEFKRGLLEAMSKKESEKNGKSVYDVALDMLYGDIRCQDTTRASVFKIISEVFTVKESEKKVTTEDRQVIMLPATGSPDETAIREIEKANKN